MHNIHSEDEYPSRTAQTMPFYLYRPFPQVELPDRTWPDKVITEAPAWCAVDLRDGNQSLINPMDPSRKLAMWNILLEIGMKEIEVGFPSASQPDFDFIRKLIEEDRIPEDVRIQVLSQCREDLLERTYEALEGAPRATVHFYNSTSPLQRRVVFRKSKEEIKQLAIEGAQMCKDFESKLKFPIDLRYEYSPENFTATELDFALEVCTAVIEVIQPTPENKMVINLPATVENSTPNIHADQIEWMCRRLPRRDSLIVSVHTHNDRGTAVAAVELGLMAGADRVEGTLFGNGERTGNVDLVTLALNLFTQGIDPKLDFSDIDRVRHVVEAVNELQVGPRHPYAGDLVYTAFSGSHQDAIKKGFAALGENYEHWEMPNLPNDPKHVGRTYEDVIRVNSQSGKGGVAYLMEASHGMKLPRRLQMEFSRVVQKQTDASGLDVSPEMLYKFFSETYLAPTKPLRLMGNVVTRSEAGTISIGADVEVNGTVERIEGESNGPISAFVQGLSKYGITVDVIDYSEHTLGGDSEAQAIAYVETTGSSSQTRWGVGVDSDISTASLKAVVSAVNRHAQFD